MEMSAKGMALKIAQILNDKKAENVKVLEIKDLTTIADYFVICNGTSNTHIKGLCDEVDFELKKADIHVAHHEGYMSASWILMDYTYVVVHIFSRESHEFYDLERLWADAPELDISNLD